MSDNLAAVLVGISFGLLAMGWVGMVMFGPGVLFVFSILSFGFAIVAGLVK